MATGPLSSLSEGSCTTLDVPTCHTASSVKQRAAWPVTQKYHGFSTPPLSPPELCHPAGWGSSPLALPLHLEEGGLSLAAAPPEDRVGGSVKRKPEKTRGYQGFRTNSERPQM